MLHWRHRRLVAVDLWGRFSHWSYQLAVIYIPIIVYGVMVLPQKFPRTENAAAGLQRLLHSRQPLPENAIQPVIQVSKQIGEFRCHAALIRAGIELTGHQFVHRA